MREAEPGMPDMEQILKQLQDATAVTAAQDPHARMIIEHEQGWQIIHAPWHGTGTGSIDMKPRCTNWTIRKR